MKQIMTKFKSSVQRDLLLKLLDMTEDQLNFTLGLLKKYKDIYGQDVMDEIVGEIRTDEEYVAHNSVGHLVNYIFCYILDDINQKYGTLLGYFLVLGKDYFDPKFKFDLSMFKEQKIEKKLIPRIIKELNSFLEI